MSQLVAMVPPPRVLSAGRGSQPPENLPFSGTMPFPWATNNRSLTRAGRYLPTVSVVLPVYNHANYLADSVRSVLSERYPLELIVIDDGSTDHPDRAISAFLGDSRLRFLRQDNRGLPAALNTGFAEAHGNFLTWTSADNRFKPGALAKLANFLIDNPEVGLCYANVQLIDSQGNPHTRSAYRSADQRASDRSILDLPRVCESLHLMNDNFINSCFLFRQSYAAAVGRHRPVCIGFEDYDYWLRVQLLGRISHCGLDEPLYEYRLHGQTMTAQLNVDAIRAAQEERLGEISELRSLLSRPAWQCNSTASTATPASAEQLAKTLLERIFSPSSEISCDANSNPIVIQLNLELAINEVPLNLTNLDDSTALIRRDYHQFLRYPPKLVLVESGPSKLLLHSQLEIPPLLRRARDSDFGAVTAAAGVPIAVVFPPESSEAASFQHQFLRLYAESEECCFVLLCLTATERATADSINQQVLNNSNLRIVDLSDCSEKPFCTTNQAHSLLYVLSGASLVLHLVGNKADSPRNTAAWFELFVETGIAAAAGLPIVYAAERPSDQNSSDQRSAVDLLADFPFGISSWSVAAPHLHLVALDINSRRGWQQLQNAFKAALAEPLNFTACDSWLDQNSFQAFTHRLGRYLALRMLD